MSYRLCWLLASKQSVLTVKTVHTASGTCHTGYTDCLLASSQHNLYGMYLMLYVQSWTPDDGRRDRPKHVECYFKKKFEKLMHLVGFTTEIYHEGRSYESQNALHISAGKPTVLPHGLRPLCQSCQKNMWNIFVTWHSGTAITVQTSGPSHLPLSSLLRFTITLPS